MSADVVGVDGPVTPVHDEKVAAPVLRRRADWPERLVEAVAKARATPFAWGRHDCALFACDCVLAMTGVDLGAPFRPRPVGARDLIMRGQEGRRRYRTAAGAINALKKIAGVHSVEALCQRLSNQGVFGELVHPGHARRGDVVLIYTDIGPALGVALGAKAVFAGPEGLETVPMGACLRAWRVG